MRDSKLPLEPAHDAQAASASSRKRDLGQTQSELQDRLKSVLELASDWYWELDDQYRFSFIDGSITNKVGINPQRLGRTRWDSGGQPVDGTWDEHKADLEARNSFRDFVYWRVNDKGEERYISASGEPFFYPDGRFRGYRGVSKDITSRMRASRLRKLEHGFTRSIAQLDEVGQVTVALIRELCQALNWECGRFLAVDEEAGLLRTVAVWSADDPKTRTYVEVARQVVYARGEGLSGRVWESRQPVWVPDIRKEPRRARHLVSIDADWGAHAVLVFPVTSGEKFLGTLVFNTRQVREPDELLLGALQAIGGQFGQFLQRKHAEQVLKQSEARFRKLLELSTDGYWEQDVEFRYTKYEASGASGERLVAIAMLGKRRWERAYVNMTPEDWAQHMDLLRARRSFRDLELCRLNERGEKVWIGVSGEPMFDESGTYTGYRGIAKDITERKLAEERIHYLAHHDALTGLPNRTLFSELLNMAIHQSKRYKRAFAVVYVDLDRFKVINDSLGHEAGDQLLRETSDRLRDALRESDVVARLGGDEFVVLVQEIDDKHQAEIVARKLLSAITRSMTIEGQECRVTASLGLSLYPSDGTEEAALMKNADVAMYKAKQGGKNNFQFYSADLNVHSLERLALENSLRRALERQEFVLHYQAKVSLKSRDITGVEALLRWNHPELGMLSPAQFIPMAEETGLIVPIGRWVLNAACREAVKWQEHGLPRVSISVNISARQFSDENLLRDIADALTASRLDPALLELELTESMVMQNIDHTMTLLAQIKRMGVRLAIDDFGIGYSSLSNLKRFPIDTLKVDRSFIRDIPGDSEDKAITEAIVAMGHSLNLTVVAEGVETREQAMFLHEQHCDELQGFLFSKPLPSDQFEALMRRPEALADLP
jgi:diguanylate cyclase (GGDEF)-like protein/PAS domain S-box-containing protein